MENYQTPAVVKTCSALSGIHYEMLHYTMTLWSCDFASGTNTDGHQREQHHMVFMWRCMRVYKSVIVRAQYVHVHTPTLYVLTPVC